MMTALPRASFRRQVSLDFDTEVIKARATLSPSLAQNVLRFVPSPTMYVKGDFQAEINGGALLSLQRSL
jgi:hypothetical protein